MSKMLKFFVHCIYELSDQVSEVAPEYLEDCENISWLMKKPQ